MYGGCLSEGKGGGIATQIRTAPVEWYSVKGGTKAPLSIEKGSCHGRKAAMTEGISFFFHETANTGKGLFPCIISVATKVNK